MAVAFPLGDELGQGDLDIFFTNVVGNPANPAEITFAIFFLDDSGGLPALEVLIGDPARIPANPAVGEFFAAIMIPTTASLGPHIIRWTFKELATSPEQTQVQEFAVVSSGTLVVSTPFTAAEQAMIDSLRLLLRDQNPDKFYRFRPPEHEGDIGQFNRICGFIWEDAELFEYLQRGLDYWNALPPLTANIGNLNRLVSGAPWWRTGVLFAAMMFAAWALQFNWTADEFSVVGDTSVRVFLGDGSEVELSIRELFAICYEGEDA